MIILLAIETALLFVVCAAFWGALTHLKDAQQQRDLAQQEVRVLTDAIARANRTPVIREVEKPRTLERSETYWEPRIEVKVDAST